MGGSHFIHKKHDALKKIWSTSRDAHYYCRIVTIPTYMREKKQRLALYIYITPVNSYSPQMAILRLGDNKKLAQGHK